MELVALGDLDGCGKDLFHAIGKRFAGIAAIGQNVFDIRQIVLVAVKGLQRALAISDIGSRDIKRVRQAIRIDADVTLDAGDKLAAVKTFVLRRIGVLDALGVNDQERRCFVPAKALSDHANHIFLRLLPKD